MTCGQDEPGARRGRNRKPVSACETHEAVTPR